MSPRLLLLCAALPLVLVACDRGGREEAEPAAPANVTEASPPPPPPPVEVKPAARTPTPLTPDEKRRALLNSRDGPGEEAPPEYAGARGAATALPSADGENDGSKPDATPPPPPSTPSTPQP